MNDDQVALRLRELAERHGAGAITDADYAAAKRQLLGDSSDVDAAQETLMLRAIDPSEQQSVKRGRGLVPLVTAVGLMILVLIVVVWSSLGR